MSERAHKDVGSSVGLLITLAAIAASALVVITLPQTIETAREEPLKFVAFLVLTLALQLLSADMYGSGGEGVSAMGMLAAGFALGPGPAMVIAILAAATQWIRGRGLLHRAIFDASDFALSAGAAALVYDLVAGLNTALVPRIAGAALAGLLYKAINTGLLCLAMSLSESVPVRKIWQERFHWARFHYLAFGPVAFACAVAYEQVGVLGVVAFSVPPALMVLSVRQYLERTRASVEEVRQANEELRRANAELEARNDDLRELFQFASGLAARAHDRGELVSYAETALSRLTGAPATVSTQVGEGAIALVAGGSPVGSLRFDRSSRFDANRWGRLREALLPQLSTAIESSALVEQVRKTHLATIAALSRSMEAKDYYTGGHTERVSSVSVALARRLGYTGTDLDAIEIGALLHDIGKIGIPERILHKPGPLDDEEWKVMKEHPVISEYILSGVDLPPIVLQIARSSHERMDGGGYPDGLAGDDIPLPARIVLVADAFDALTSDRPYRRGRRVQAALEEMRAHAGTQFCPMVVEALERLYREEPHVLGVTTLRAVEAGAA